MAMQKNEFASARHTANVNRNLFVGTMLIYGALVPSMFLFFLNLGESTWSEMVDSDAVNEAILFTFFAGILFFVAARLQVPTIRTVKLDSRKFDILFWLGLVGLILNLILNAVFGMVSVNLTSQRPVWATYSGYIGQVLIFGAYATYFREARIAVISKKLVVIGFFYLLIGALSWSRSAILQLIFYYLLARVYSLKWVPLRPGKLAKYGSIIGTIGLGSSILGQYFRGGVTEIQGFVVQMFERVFLNNVALYLSISRFDEVNHILMDNQPWVILSQLFSFAVERTEYPSSLRFIELSGGTVAEDERGHVSGYVFGWLGLGYGMLGFIGGLIFIFLVFYLLFYWLKRLHRLGDSMKAHVFFVVPAFTLVEFFTNLGLDSFCEKLFKNCLYCFFLYIICSFYQSFGQAQNSVPTSLS
jgi:hypothetical protein